MHLNGGDSAQITARRASATASHAKPALAAVGPWLAQAGLPFLLIAYLGLRGGGYDAIVRGEIGIAAWWIVLLGAAVGALPLVRLSRAVWTSLGLMCAFAAWTALGIGWSESAERSVAELGRVTALLGVFALALSVQNGDGLRRMVGGVGAGIALVAGVALLSRLQPAWFPALEAPRFLPETQARLHYPLNYWNGLAAFVAIGIPLLFALATVARHTLTRALAVAVIPALALTAFFTLSRGGAVEIAAALAVLFVLHPRRLALLLPAILATVASAILIVAANQRGALVDGLTTAAATRQGDEMLAMTLVVCAGAGLIALAIALAERHGVGPRLQVSRRAATATAGAGVAAALLIALAAGVPGTASDAWQDFKDPAVPAASAERFDSASGSGRYQSWQTAIEAGNTEPLVGIGPGTYEYFWAREGTLPTFIRDAHSLYLETYAELGIVGLILILALVASPFAFGIRRFSALDPERRVLLAGALAACAAFAVAAAIDWVWELTVLPVVFLLLAAAVIARPSLSAHGPAEPGRGLNLANGAAATGRASQSRSRFVLPALALAALVAVAIPMAGAGAVRDSQAEVRSQDLSAALNQARTASNVEPYAATPSLQEALILELQGDLGGALAAARAATQKEATNWRTWLVLSQLEAQAGNTAESVAAYREARSLNPRSALFQ